MQTSSGAPESIFKMATSYGGVPSLFRGMAAPLSTACVVNAIIFSSYGWSSRMYDQYVEPPSKQNEITHDSSIKAFACGSFAGLVQAVVICPMEHIKCRLQVQHGKGAVDNLYKGPFQAAKKIISGHGMNGMYRGWWVTLWREIPAFGAYFACYDFGKDKINSFFARQKGLDEEAEALSDNGFPEHTHTWVASALAGGLTGAATWAMVYPMDIIKTKIHTTPMDAPVDSRRILAVGRQIVEQHGWRRLFRGLNITVLRAFPVNGIIFPVYEYCLMHIAGMEY
jgi:solute carrier family 25 carnitine/acylcarnitine transporter 20/29